MSQALTNLINLVQLEPLDSGLFRGHNEDLALRQVFGGQVVAQALHAAKQTVDESKLVHSFHSYFLRPGDNNKAIIYDVENLRDGKSLSARRVKAMQDGQPIFYMTASFQGEEQGFNHQKSMPQVPSPEKLLNEQQLIEKMAHLMPKSLVAVFSAERPLDIRPVQVHNPLKGHVAEPTRQIWIKANGQLPDDPALHQAILGYASDLNFLPVSLQPHGKGFLEPELQVATIDHSMWFHRPVNLNEWILYDVESPSASGNRGFVRGEFYSADGQLIASAVQEGVIRQRV